MYYDDEARRFNFLSGLLLGAALGTGLALLAVPQRGARKPTLRSGATSMRKAVKEQASRAFGHIREEFTEREG